MTSGHHGEPEARQTEHTGHWPRRQTRTVTFSVLVSAVLWALTPVAHHAAGGYASNLTWTLAATTTLGTIGYSVFIAGRLGHDQRTRRLEDLVQQMYDRQGQLAGEIQDRQEAAARQWEETAQHIERLQSELSDRLVQQLDALAATAVTAMTAAWDEHKRALGDIRKRVGKLLTSQEDRENLMRVRYNDFDSKARELDERMNALALLIESRMPPRSLPFKRPTGG